jgi:hypothetical protein
MNWREKGYDSSYLGKKEGENKVERELSKVYNIVSEL